MRRLTTARCLLSSGKILLDMAVQKRWSFGLGTIFSLIVIYFIFLYSRGKSWTLLAFLTKWYLIIVGGFIALSFGIIILVLLLSILMISIAAFRMRSSSKKYKKQKNEEIIDAEFKVKE